MEAGHGALAFSRGGHLKRILVEAKSAATSFRWCSRLQSEPGYLPVSPAYHMLEHVAE